MDTGADEAGGVYVAWQFPRVQHDELLSYLRVHRDRETSVVVLEYEVHGKSVQTGRPYDNRFVSIVTVNGRKVTHWRDYLDPVAVFDAAGWPQPRRLSVRAGQPNSRSGDWS